jgi:hypothetical protein
VVLSLMHFLYRAFVGVLGIEGWRPSTIGLEARYIVFTFFARTAMPLCGGSRRNIIPIKSICMNFRSCLRNAIRS